MFKISKVVAAAAAVLVSSAASAAPVVVDLFDVLQDPLTVSLTNPGPVWSQVGSASEPTIFGGYRDLGIGFVTGNITSSTGNTASISVEEGAGPGAGNRYLSINNGSGVAATAVVRWDGEQAGTGAIGSAFDTVDKNGTGGLFLGGVNDFFELLTISSDLGFEFTLQLFTDDTHWSSITLVSTSHLENFPGTTSYIPLAAFLDCDNLMGGPETTCGADGAVNLSSVGAIQLIVDPMGNKVDIDLRLNQVTVVPEPATVALTGLALLAAAGIGRKRRPQA